MNKKLFLSIFLFAFCLNLSCNTESKSPDQKESSGKLQVTVFGGAEQVSGSLTLVETGNSRFLIDCGLYYPEGEGEHDERQNKADELNSGLPVDAGTIDAIFVTHAHLDHIGRIPLMFENGFKGKIYCTNGTKIIMREMLLEQIRYDNKLRDWEFSINNIKEGYSESKYVTAHWNGCTWQEKISPNNLRSKSGKRTVVQKELGLDMSPCRVCAEITLESILPHVESYEYNSDIKSENNTIIKFLDAGHIPGSASVLMVVNPGKGINGKLLFSGDLGNYIALFQNGPDPAPEVDAIWMESTYGAFQRDKNVKSEFTDFQNSVSRVVNNGGIAWIPAFALDRTQKVLYLISKAKKEHIIPENVKVYSPSPTAFAITEIYKTEMRIKNGWFKKELYNETELFPEFKRELPEIIPKPCILITTSGMMDAAFSDKLLRQMLPEKTTSVFLVGYQDPCTPGGQLKQDKQMIEWNENRIEVNAEILNYNAFTAHADADDLIHWLSNQNKDKVKIFLVHGEHSKMKDQIQNLTNKGFKNISIPVKGDVIDFSGD